MTTVAVEEDHDRHQCWKEDSKLVWSSCLWDMIGWWVQWRPYLEHTGEIRSKEQPVPYYCLHSSFPWRLEQKQTLFEISWKTFHLEAGCPSEPTFLPFLFSFIFFWWGAYYMAHAGFGLFIFLSQTSKCEYSKCLTILSPEALFKWFLFDWPISVQKK